MSNGKAITFINEKGGIGKTSTCFNVAWEMTLRGKKVLMIDMDGQRANLTFFCGVNKDNDIKTMFHVLMQEIPIKDVIVNVKEGLGLVPANALLANLSSEAKIPRMKKAVKEAKEVYDYVFIDVNPTPNWTHVLALTATDYCVIPMLPDITSLEANRGIAESINEVKETFNPSLQVLGLLFNKNNTNTNLSKEVSQQAEKMAKALDTRVFDVKIRNAVSMGESVIGHVGITEYSPTSKVADDVRELTDEILKETV